MKRAAEWAADALIIAALLMAIGYAGSGDIEQATAVAQWQNTTGLE